jgi:sigma-B regulation protein RsbU (phosphoserine phosphatase)
VVVVHDSAGLWHDAIVALLRRTQMAQPDELPEEINAALQALGLDVTVYLVDQEQRLLHPLPERGKPTPPAIPIDGTLPGRAFTLVRSAWSGGADSPHRIWVPMVDGAERLGVADVLLRDHEPGDDLRQRCETLVGLLGHLVSTKTPYGDLLHKVRRNQPMSSGAELLSSMLPPLTFSCRRLVVSGVLEPCYDMGGDAYDYAVDGPMARLAILDAMGRGLQAGITCAVALAALRAARRDGHGLDDMARSVDAALLEQFADMRFVTGVLVEMNLDSGRLQYLNAGHPPPLLIRHGRTVRTLTGGRRLPMGLAERTIEIGEETLEPGDRILLHTDGVTDGRAPDGTPFGIERLVQLVERGERDRLPAPEKLRRMAHRLVEYQQGRLFDDATLLLAEWSSEAADRTRP